MKLNDQGYFNGWECFKHYILAILPRCKSHIQLPDRVNVSLGEKEERLMMTGLHSVADIFCIGCGSIVGWKYVRIRDSDTI